MFPRLIVMISTLFKRTQSTARNQTLTVTFSTCSLYYRFDKYVMPSLRLSHSEGRIREVKLDVYGKQQMAKIKLLPSVFSALYSGIKIFVFAVSSMRHFYIFA